MNAFTMPFLCADFGPWRKMSSAMPPMSAITTSSVTMCPSHQDQRGELLKSGRKGLLWRLLERPVLPGDLGVFVEHTYIRFLSVLS